MYIVLPHFISSVVSYFRIHVPVFHMT